MSEGHLRQRAPLEIKGKGKKKKGFHFKNSFYYYSVSERIGDSRSIRNGPDEQP